MHATKSIAQRIESRHEESARSCDNCHEDAVVIDEETPLCGECFMQASLRRLAEEVRHGHESRSARILSDLATELGEDFFEWAESVSREGATAIAPKPA